MIFTCWLLSTTCAIILATCLILQRRALGYERDDRELALISARQPGRNLETAVWEAYGQEALDRLRAKIDAAPWGARNWSTLIVNGRLVGYASSRGWRHASEEERAAHDALQEPSRLTVFTTPSEKDS